MKTVRELRNDSLSKYGELIEDYHKSLIVPNSVRYSPSKLIEALVAPFFSGFVDLDPWANPRSNEKLQELGLTVMANTGEFEEKFLDGYDTPWGERDIRHIWANPPFGIELRWFVDKVEDEMDFEQCSRTMLTIVPFRPWRRWFKDLKSNDSFVTGYVLPVNCQRELELHFEAEPKYRRKAKRYKKCMIVMLFCTEDEATCLKKKSLLKTLMQDLVGKDLVGKTWLVIEETK